jgi:hypothetical protein
MCNGLTFGQQKNESNTEKKRKIIHLKKEDGKKKSKKIANNKSLGEWKLILFI